jgi:plastocyanin
MRFIGSALVASAIVAGACGGGSKAPAADETPAAAPAAAVGAAAPITGTTHEVKMLGDEKGYRFEPKDLTIKAGDGIKFIFITGGPHNVAFNPADIPADVKPQLDANMGEGKLAELSSKMMLNPNEFVIVSFANIKPGTYPFNCTPHLAMNMKGTVTVQ